MIKYRSMGKERGCDGAGCGHFGAPRGSRTHKGEDIVIPPGSEIYPLVMGVCTKLGICYSDDHYYRYVEIRVKNFYHRYFYVEPTILVGEMAMVDKPIGLLQDVTTRYKGTDYEDMQPHCHFEIKDGNGNYLDPKKVIS